MYVIIGASGGIGAVVARNLLQRGKQVRVVGRSAERLAPLVAEGATPYLIPSITDADALVGAFGGAEAAYTMAPPLSGDVSYQAVGRTMAVALARAGVGHVVNLSALGADLGEAGGHTADYTDLERGFAAVAGLDVLHIRPSLFMTSFFGWIDPIKRYGAVQGMLRGDLGVPRIASSDIAQVVADALLAAPLQGSSSRELHGQRDLSMDEAAAIIGEAIGMPSLRYVEVPPDEWARLQIERFGRSPEAAERMNRMYAAWNDGSLMRTAEARSAANTTPTRFETFVREEFLPRYRSAAAG